LARMATKKRKELPVLALAPSGSLALEGVHLTNSALGSVALLQQQSNRFHQ